MPESAAGPFRMGCGLRPRANRNPLSPDTLVVKPRHSLSGSISPNTPGEPVRTGDRRCRNTNGQNPEIEYRGTGY